MIVNHNISSVNAERHFGINNRNQNKNFEKLSSGLRINHAGDDPVGMAISEKMRAQIRSLRQAERNIQDDISLLQTTEGYLHEILSILHRLREMSVQSSNGVYTAQDREYMQLEVEQLVDEVDRISSQAEFNRLQVLSGKYSGSPLSSNAEYVTQGVAGDMEFPHEAMWFHIGPNMDNRERIYIASVNSYSLGLKQDVSETGRMISLSTADSANMTIGILDLSLHKVLRTVSELGAYQNRLEHASKGVLNTHENLKAAESRIRDVNMAEEMIDFAKNQILMQTSMEMLAKSNMKPSVVMRLLQ